MTTFFHELIFTLSPSRALSSSSLHAMLQLLDKNGADISEELEKCSNTTCLGEPWCSAWGHCQGFMDKPTTILDTPPSSNNKELDDIFLSLTQQQLSATAEDNTENQVSNFPPLACTNSLLANAQNLVPHQQSPHVQCQLKIVLLLQPQKKIILLQEFPVFQKKNT